jgi:hypothetical protein
LAGALSLAPSSESVIYEDATHAQLHNKSDLTLPDFH